MQLYACATLVQGGKVGLGSRGLDPRTTFHSHPATLGALEAPSTYPRPKALDDLRPSALGFSAHPTTRDDCGFLDPVIGGGNRRPTPPAGPEGPGLSHPRPMRSWATKEVIHKDQRRSEWTQPMKHCVSEWLLAQALS